MQIDQLDLDKLQIITYPAPILALTAQPVDKITPAIMNLTDRVVEMMVKFNGVGLAAPQVGVSLRMFVMSLTGKVQDAEVFINPELSGFHDWSEMEEGCLSIPDVRARVRRPGACKAHAIDADGNNFVIDAVDFSATVIQHETDHLNGTLFVDRLNTIARMSCKRTLKELERLYESENN